ncbi:alpha/beta hydrolase [Antrihabitans cavernicola]|uniref:Alpha/beta hydrolase n=1 Tax=Antrihabitans cavernicola TaxID=2495913 RepID=A0A5A7SBB7_9NOCA|nr:alpha/beta hydrolase [Spelaeibacter cavernicola]KAA0023428.1 alpha/beta hydrolase [Spelaeibacter cavernicola]
MRWTRLAAAISIVVAVCSACGAGPSERPGVAVEQQSPGSGSAGTTTPNAADKLPALAKPKGDLAWRDCTRTTLDSLGLGAGPNGLILECADFPAPVDSSGAIYGTFNVGALRARLPQTPLDAAPLVLTSGSDRSSTATLAGLAAAPAGGLLAARPIVAVDRRGIGTSTPIDCIPADTRRALADNAEFTMEYPDAVTALAAFSEKATIACKDFLQPQELAFDAPHAADDLEQLRLVWQVDSLGIIGTGNGTNVALAYAAKYPTHVGRLIMDSPPGVNMDATTITEQRVQGAEAAVAAFSARCVGLKCSLGPDPHGAIIDLIKRAGNGGLGPISSNALLTALYGFLGSPRADQQNQLRALSDALSSAGTGDTAALSALIASQEAAIGSDGQFIARCSDGQQWPAQQRVRELQEKWDRLYPVFGKQAATSMLACTAWPVAPSPAGVTNLKIPVLALSGAADPVAGNAGLGSATGAVSGAGGRPSTVNWQGWGHPTLAHSGCAQAAAVAYADTGKLPPNGTVCPA